MLRFWCSRIPTLKLLVTEGCTTSTFLHPHRPLSFLCSSTRSLTSAATSNLPSQSKPNTLRPEPLMTDTESDLFNYTSGRFLANEAYRLRERRRVFNAPGLFNEIAKAIDCRTDQIVDFRKLEEGHLNRVFLVTLDTKFQLIARIPYPCTIAKPYAVASEVATMRFLRSKGLPIPEVYGYSFTENNEAETEYILMEYVNGADLSQIWYDLKEEEIVTLMDQVVKIESNMMSISFPAGGSIYYTKDLMELSGNEGSPLDDESGVVEEQGFCVGPDVSPALWEGRREMLDVFRGPYTDGKSVMTTGAQKELAYLERFGAPRQAYDRIRRASYNYQKQPPSDHVKNLRKYLRVAPWLVPSDCSLHTFCIRHPQLSEHNIKVLTNSGSPKIISILDWQYAAVLPIFLNAYLPAFIPVEADEVTRSLEVHPTNRLPENFAELEEEDKAAEQQLYRRRLVHYHYALRTATENQFHHHGLTYPLNSFTRRIYILAAEPWVGETNALLCTLMNLARDWDNVISEHSFTHPISIQTTKEGQFDTINSLGALIDLVRFWEYISTVEAPCPITFTTEEVDAAMKLKQDILEGNETWETLLQLLGCGYDTWTSNENYEASKALAEETKEAFASCGDEEDSAITEDMIVNFKTNWPFDDMCEEEMEEYK